MSVPLARQVVEEALRRGRKITCAESCTGGLISAALTDVAGSSGMFERGFVTYSNDAKADMLGVPTDIIARHGAVSEEVTHAMATGARVAASADLAVSVSGIAGPGGSDFKPEGRVCYGLATSSGTHTLTIEHGALGRAQVRQAATLQALRLLLDALNQD